MLKEDIKTIRKWQNEAEERYGWYIHTVTYNEEIPNMKFKEAHTHALLKNYGHLDLQIIAVPYMTIEFAKKLFDSIVTDIIADSVYLDSEYVWSDGHEPIIAKVVKEEGSGRMLLRLITPDVNDKYPWDDDCDPEYKKQFTEKDAEENKYLMSL